MLVVGGFLFVAVSGDIDDAVIIVFFLTSVGGYSRCSHDGFKNCSKILTSTAADD